MDYVDEGVDPRAVFNYALGFSKINNRERFQPDVWEAEDRFTKSTRPSDVADKERIDYLYPEPPAPSTVRRYLDDLVALTRIARNAGARTVVVKLPMPDRFRARLPNEDAFDHALIETMKREGIQFHDYSDVLPEPKYYFDADHLNRDGAEAFLNRILLGLLAGGGD